jgi:hypothetical protein
MQQFNLSAVNTIEKEEQKISLLARMIEKIKEHKITTRS